MPLPSRDLLITALETNSHHGVGILLQRFFPRSDEFVCLRSTSLYHHEEPFGSAHVELNSRFLTPEETEAQLARILANYSIRRILCVPYYRADFVHGILAKELTGAPLCTFLMDDQNIFSAEVSDPTVAALLAVSDLRLGISQEMCAAYTRKYGQPVHLLPPLLERSPPLVPCYWSEVPGEPLRAAMIGNVWTAKRFAQLRELTRGSGLHLDWYGNGPRAKWLEGTPEDWEADHIRCMGFLPEEDLVAALASYPFVVVPSGSLDPSDDNPAFTHLSLPSRLLFLHGTTDTPVLVLGSPESAAGRFVRRLDTGVCSAYDAADLDEQRRRLLDPAIRERLRANIRRWSKSLAMENAGDWIWRSLAARAPVSAPFQAAFPPLPGDPPALAALAPARPADLPVHPRRGEPFRDAFEGSFRFSRQSHLPVLADFDPGLPEAPALELSRFQGAAANYMVQGAVRAGGDVLFLGADLPAGVQAIGQTHRLWRMKDPGRWQAEGFAGEPSYLQDALTGADHPTVFPQFDAIISTGWCGQLADDPHVLEGLSLYLEGCTRPGGINAHFFSAVLHPGYFWTAAPHAYLKRRFRGDLDRDTVDELLWQRDLFLMAEPAYAAFWQASTGRTYADFGRPLSLGLFWRKR